MLEAFTAAAGVPEGLGGSCGLFEGRGGAFKSKAYLRLCEQFVLLKGELRAIFEGNQQVKEPTAALAKKLGQMDFTIQQLRAEAMSSPNGQQLMEEVQAFATEIDALRESADAFKRKLLHGSVVPVPEQTRDLNATSGALINDCTAVARSTEGVGLDIMQQLQQQRHTILNSKRLGEDTEAEASVSGRLIRHMLYRKRLDRTLLIGVIVLLGLGIVLVLLHTKLRVI